MTKIEDVPECISLEVKVGLGIQLLSHLMFGDQKRENVIDALLEIFNRDDF